MNADQTHRDVAALADRGLAPEAYRRAVLDRVSRAVPVTAACVASADPASLALVAHTSAGVDRRGASLLYDSEYGVADVASHRSLAAGAPARVLSQATGGDLSRSHRFRTLLAPMGWTHELRAAATDRAGTWGFLHLYRDDTHADFTADELDLVRRLGPTIAAGMRQSLLRGVATTVPVTRAPAVWVLDEHYRLAQSTPGSEALLGALRDDEAPSGETPEILVGMAAMARAAVAATAPGGEPSVPRLQVPTTDGDWLTLHANVLETVSGGGAERTVITGVPAGPADLLELTLLAHRLTPAERTTVALVLSGRSTKQIAEELVLSAHTVQDRLQDVFGKIGVRSRRELVALLTSG